MAGTLRRGRIRLFRRLRNNLLAGIIVTAPIGLTIYFSWLFIDFVDSKITVLIPATYNPETYLPFGIPGLGVVVVIVALTLIGALAAGIVGRTLVQTGEQILARMPVVRTMYTALKQIFETVLARSSKAFREVVLIEYPRKGIWALGFATGTTKGEVQNVIEDEVVNVFLPTTPNPTSGFLLFLRRKEVVFLDMTVEEGIKMVISGGIVAPPDRRRKKERETPKIRAVAREARPSEA
ncbi:MAG: DUF502 domain-containing protein [Alphaproteobacteria bacterium]